jgi:hypothetical protein
MKKTSKDTFNIDDIKDEKIKERIKTHIELFKIIDELIKSNLEKMKKPHDIKAVYDNRG